MDATTNPPRTDAATDCRHGALVLARLLGERAAAIAARVAVGQAAGEPDDRRAGDREMIDLLAHLARAVESDSVALFVDHVRWLQVRRDPLSTSAGLSTIVGDLAAALAADVPAELLPTLNRHLDQAREQLAAPATAMALQSFLDPDAALSALAADYLGALLAGNRHLASRLILDAVDSGTPIRQIYLDVFQRSQWEIGRLWQLNRISVAQEHFCTAATQLVMSQLYDRIFSTAKLGRTLVATCATHDLHELGIRMVSDFFEMEGWDTFYLGADTPVADVVRECVVHRADVLAVSVTMTAQLGHVHQVVAAVRAEPACANIRILVGGYPFALDPELWRKVGADATASDALGAVAVANSLLDAIRR